MDAESWIQGYFAGVALHQHLRTPGVRPSVIARMSATGIAADLEWFADLSGVAALTSLSAEFVGDVSASYSYDGASYTNPVPLAELLRANPVSLSRGVRLWFRFHLADDAADLSEFALWGIPREEAV